MSVRKHPLVAMPSVAAALLPKFACPACAAAALGILNVAGLGYLLTTPYLLPATATVLAVTLGVSAYWARMRREWWPFGAAVAGAAAVLIGKFAWESNVALYGGIGLLAASIVWSGRRRETAVECEACGSTTRK